MACFSIAFSTEASENIDELARKRGMTRTELVRRALGVYAALDDNLEPGGIILIRNPGGERSLLGL